MKKYDIRLMGNEQREWVSTIPHEVKSCIMHPSTFEAIPYYVAVDEKHYAIYILKFE